MHIPVMLKEIIEYLNIKNNGKYIDGTLGGGGYTRAITDVLSDKGKILSIDLDPLAINNFLKYKTEKNIVVNDNFANLKKIVLDNFNKDQKFDGIVADLGLSSAQLDDKHRGFSFENDSSLDMAFGPGIVNNTFWIVNNYTQKELENIIKDYGEESWAKKISWKIIEHRRKEKIINARQLADIICQTIPKKFWSRRINPATKTFQALRMETNNEIENLEKFLEQAVELLKPGGHLIIVSFHSLEDRIVKIFFKNKFREDKNNFKILTKKPIGPSEEEVKNNFRSRSAKLRVLEKISN